MSNKINKIEVTYANGRKVTYEEDSDNFSCLPWFWDCECLHSPYIHPKTEKMCPRCTAEEVRDSSADSRFPEVVEMMARRLAKEKPSAGKLTIRPALTTKNLIRIVRQRKPQELVFIHKGPAGTRLRLRYKNKHLEYSFGGRFLEARIYTVVPGGLSGVFRSCLDYGGNCMSWVVDGLKQCTDHEGCLVVWHEKDRKSCPVCERQGVWITLRDQLVESKEALEERVLSLEQALTDMTAERDEWQEKARFFSD